MKYYISVLTGKGYKYCDQQFFRALGKATVGIECYVQILDISCDQEYFFRLQNRVKEWLGHDKFLVKHFNTPKTNTIKEELDNMTEGLNYNRTSFLETKAKYFVNIESNVIVPSNIFDMFQEVESHADVVGTVYDTELQSMILFDPAIDMLFMNDYILGGCTMYPREVIEQIPFRYSFSNYYVHYGCWFCDDARKTIPGVRIGNYSKIKSKQIKKQYPEDKK